MKASTDIIKLTKGQFGVIPTEERELLLVLPAISKALSPCAHSYHTHFVEMTLAHADVALCR